LLLTNLPRQVLGLPMAVAQLSFQARAARLQQVAGRPQGPS
jgi:hypothetical protein